MALLDREIKEYITSLDIDALWMRNTGGLFEIVAHDNPGARLV